MKFIRKIFRKNLINESNTIKVEDPYIKISNLIKEARISRNLSIEDLSKISKIPASIIISLEKNDKERRPKYPFFRSVLLKLEECLYLKKFKLVELANKEIIKTKEKKSKNYNYLINKFDFFNTWQGSILYILILLFSLLILNKSYLNTNSIEFKFIEREIKK